MTDDKPNPNQDALLALFFYLLPKLLLGLLWYLSGGYYFFGSRSCMWCGVKWPHLDWVGESIFKGHRNNENRRKCKNCGRGT